MKEFFFESCCVFKEAGFVRVRVPAREGTTFLALINGDSIPRTLRADTNVTLTVTDTYGKLPELPELDELNSQYDPWLDVIFQVPTLVEYTERDGRKGLLVHIGGIITIDDPGKSWPLSLAATQAIEGFRFLYDDDSDVGPHWPVTPTPKASA